MDKRDLRIDIATVPDIAEDAAYSSCLRKLQSGGYTPTQSGRGGHLSTERPFATGVGRQGNFHVAFFRGFFGDRHFLPETCV